MALGWMAGAWLLGSQGIAQETPDLERIVARASAGDPEAMLALGHAHAGGQGGLKPDHAEALKWYRRAADKGFAPALFSVAIAYELGRGVEVDDAQAFKYYLAAAERGNAPAQFNVGNMYAAGRGVGRDYFEANLWFKQAADNGVVEALFNLGFAYEAGHGVKKDDAQAARWYRLAAERGYARAQYNYALLLDDGRGVPLDRVAAAKYYRAAAEQNYAPAQVNYGLLIAEGRSGTPADPAHAYVWLARAVQNGASPEARDALARTMTTEQLAAANRLAGVPAVTTTAESEAKGDSTALVAQLREQGRRLAARVESLTADKEAAERQIAALAAQVRDLQQERTVTTGAMSDPGRQDSVIANLQRDNARLNDEVKRSTLELLSLNNQLRSLREQKEGRPTAGGSPSDDAALTTMREQIRTLSNEKADLEQWSRSIEKTLNETTARAAALEETVIDLRRQTAATDRKETGSSVARLEARVAELSREKGELESRLAEAVTIRTRQASAGTGGGAELAEANAAVEKLTATVSELTAENQKLSQDLDNAQKSTAAALAAQTQAVDAANPEAFRMELSTLQSRVKALEAEVEEERADAARELGTLAAQLQRTRESNRSLTDANRALVAARESDLAGVKDDTVRLQARVRELEDLNADGRRQLQQQAVGLREVTAERDALRAQLVDAQKVATVLPGMADEKAALQERLETVGGRLVKLQQEFDELEKAHSELSREAAAKTDEAEEAKAALTALQSRLAEADRADETRAGTVAELTQANERLEKEQQELKRQAETYRAEIARLTLVAGTAEQLKAEAERSSQQNVEAVTAQMVQLQREVEAGRSNLARLGEAQAAQERERQRVITQLRAENAAMSARLTQAQGTLDQIAQAARLGTPAAAIATGGSPVVRPVPAPSSPVRYHTVVEGDSLSRISVRYYGTANRWQEIFQANRDVLEGNSVLRVGMQLRLP